jgi:hypothetical protein
MEQGFATTGKANGCGSASGQFLDQTLKDDWGHLCSPVPGFKRVLSRIAEVAVVSTTLRNINVNPNRPRYAGGLSVRQHSLTKHFHVIQGTLGKKVTIMSRYDLEQFSGPVIHTQAVPKTIGLKIAQS